MRKFKIEQYKNCLHKENWVVRPVALGVGQNLVRQYHYAKGGSNTATYMHGLFKKEDFNEECVGVAWWIPPTKGAAIATYARNWKGVLALSRLVIKPDIPKNACTFLLSRSRKLIDRTRWPALVTYADTWRGHTGSIYKADNWIFIGETKPEATWVKDGRMIARKAGPHTRTKAEMEALGAVMIGRYSKYKFVHILDKELTHEEI